jgi:type II secretory pathway component PulC
MNRAVVAAVFALGLAGCGGSTESMAVEETRDLLAAGEDAPAAGTPVEPGTIRRADLDALLAAGPGALLTRVETAPVHQAGRFVGFRITGFPQGAPRAIDLRAGDVVLRVNGHGVERPEQYFEAFRTLAGAAEIRFEILRDGEPMELLYPISK